MKANLTEIIVLYSDTIPKPEFEKTAKVVARGLAPLREKGEELRFTVCAFGADGANYKKVCENAHECKVIARSLISGKSGYEIALVDSAMQLIGEVGTRYCNTPDDEIPSRIIFVTAVFGIDNASKKCTYDDLRNIIGHQSNTYKWEFFVLTDTPSNAERLGVPESNVVVTPTDTDGYLKSAIEKLCELL